MILRWVCATSPWGKCENPLESEKLPQIGIWTGQPMVLAPHSSSHRGGRLAYVCPHPILDYVPNFHCGINKNTWSVMLVSSSNLRNPHNKRNMPLNCNLWSTVLFATISQKLDQNHCFHITSLPEPPILCNFRVYYRFTHLFINRTIF